MINDKKLSEIAERANAGLPFDNEVEMFIANLQSDIHILIAEVQKLRAEIESMYELRAGEDI